MGIRDWAMLLALSVLWGGSFFFVGVVGSDLPPLTIVTLRVGLAAVTLWGIAAAMGLRPPGSARIWIAFAGMGLLNNVIPFTLFVWGQTQIASGLAAILNATTPLFTVIVAGLLLADERMTLLKISGVAVGFAGAVVMIGPDALGGLGDNVLAQLACLGGALSYAFAGVFGRRFRAMGVDPIVTAAGQVTASTVILAPITLLVDKPWALAMPGGDTWAAIAGLAVLSTGFAYILYFRILASAGATNLLLVTFLIPVTAVLLGSLVLGERLDSVYFVGMGLIGLGLSAIDGRLWRWLRA
jgi:drug/metabolite transporter (DMT)-like permease